MWSEGGVAAMRCGLVGGVEVKKILNDMLYIKMAEIKNVV